MDTTIFTTTMADVEQYRSVQLLPEYLANQIAAGEVVQRPESVVKELVENAVDAGASAVTVVVRQAGKQLIHVIDNGSGMQREDLELSVVRHATSKIRTHDDLHAIGTLGFRGEALASIAAVADVEIRTQRRGEATGWTLTSRPGEAPVVVPAHHETGTQVLVRNLFYNVPARRKFLKADLTEFRYISETMQRLALSRPDVRFTFFDGGALTYDVQPQQLEQRMIALLGLHNSGAVVPVDHREGEVVLTGFVGVPAMARQSRSGQFLFLNQRTISSRSLSHAVVSAFEHLLEPGQHPVFVLALTVDVRRVDVNVHPQKHEVKFDDERAIYLLVQHGVAKALQSSNIIAPSIADLNLSAQPLQSLGGSAEGTSFVVNRLTGEILPSTPWPKHQGGWTSTHKPQSFGSAAQQGYSALFGGQDGSPVRTQVRDIVSVEGRWAVLVRNGGLAVVDVRSAYERVVYDRVVRKESNVSSEQALLFSVTTTLSIAYRPLLREYHADFESIGFRLLIEENGDVRIDAVPGEVAPGTEEQALLELLHELEGSGRLPTDQRRLRLAAIFAKRQASRKSVSMSTVELSALVDALFETSMPHASPSGKPTYINIPFDEIEQRFR